MRIRECRSGRGKTFKVWVFSLEGLSDGKNFVAVVSVRANGFVCKQPLTIKRHDLEICCCTKARPHIRASGTDAVSNLRLQVFMDVEGWRVNNILKKKIISKINIKARKVIATLVLLFR